ncbi:hypothetical protein Sru01_36880 [Sphaerisporangium rufum]|uniref:Glycosyltransferase RgtA/B/C/D-like domain-containing protein n=1 Tax=Sphaerisporangium rufum TaxID=1381558 RepID=A0A919R5D4_9ACTN|nr:hypothetical protein [Sphaerisporangium rufum]GII78706.1 hypothetical protein Sru01_36880 [Sphaerisporangium rufum]
MEVLIVIVLAIVVVTVARRGVDASQAPRVVPVILAAYLARLAALYLLQRNQLLGYGGDNLGYERLGMMVADRWQREGLSFVSADDMPEVLSVAVPANVFALVITLNGGLATLGCTAVVAALACVLCVVVYRFARLVGADAPAAFRLLAVTAFMPSFLLHTADTYKDGFNALFTVGALALGVSMTRRFALWKPLAIAPLLWALWYVRPYMVFTCVLPLALGVSGLRRLVSLRTTVLAVTALLGALLLAGSAVPGPAVQSMEAQLDTGQSDIVRHNHQAKGSGVRFDDGGRAWGELHTKVLYTLLSPFPWTPGSRVLQLGKIDTCVWYVLLAYAVAGARRLWRRDRAVLLVLLLFLVPTTVAFATGMANIGLTFRQRMPIVMVASLLAAVAWTRERDGHPVPPAGPQAPPGGQARPFVPRQAAAR